ncbi:MAG: PAS domain-containing protein, partial [Deltaproteobacteria bacterium]|nr:PAS domain-containing protein [Deltaproteobacteria bacterium]
MSDEKRPIATALAGNARWAVVYGLFVTAAAVGVAFAAGSVPGPVLGIALVAVLLPAGYLAFLRPRHRQLRTYARWRDVMPCYLSVQDRDLKIIDANDRFQGEFGARIGESCFKVYKNSDVPCEDCPVLRTFQDGRVHTSEETVLRRGSEANVVVTSAPLKDDNGQVVAVVEMSTDVTEIKTLRRELEQSRRDYKRLFEHVPCFICVLDRDLRIIESNEMYRNGFGGEAGTHCYEACKAREAPCEDCLVARTFEDGESHTSEETLTTRKGRRLNLVVHSMPVRDDSGAITAVMEVFTDITQVKELQRQLTLMGRAVAGMAHRIKNLLMGLEGGIFVVNTGMETDDRNTVAEGWEMVERNVNRVSRIVKDLLYCSK